MNIPNKAPRYLIVAIISSMFSSYAFVSSTIWVKNNTDKPIRARVAFYGERSYGLIGEGCRINCPYFFDVAAHSKGLYGTLEGESITNIEIFDKQTNKSFGWVDINGSSEDYDIVFDGNRPTKIKHVEEKSNWVIDASKPMNPEVLAKRRKH